MIEASIGKRYGVRDVLRAATLRVAEGTVHALVGENGAGKSTLVKIIAGVVKGDRGTLTVSGKAHDAADWTRRDARLAGIGIVQQHGAFAPTLSVVENAVLGVEPRRALGGIRTPILDLDATADALVALGKRIGFEVDPWARAETLSLGAAQRAEIVAALHYGAKLLILDEPTAVLAPIEVDGLLETLRRLAKDGTSVVIVTHKLDEVRAVADEVTVLRAGETVATLTAAGDARRFDVREIARLMVGAEPPESTRSSPPRDDAPNVLTLERVGVDDALHDIDLDLRAGEIVGVAGVDGNGQRELALAIAGLCAHRGVVRLDGRDVSSATPRMRLAAGLAHIPEDRHHGGLVLDDTVAENMVLGRRDITGFVLDRVAIAAFADRHVASLDMRPPDRTAVARALSGGNQQKIVVARELTRPALTCVIAAQPTRGVDLGAVVRIHAHLRAVASSGAAVLVISADLDELLALCHRVVVLLRGRVVGERSGAALAETDTRASLGALMTGAGAAA